MKNILLLILSLFISVSAYGKIELRARHLRTTDGLPSNSIRYIYQDSKGFLWLSTLNGVSRYDGNAFMNLNTVVADATQLSLADNRIYKTLEDKHGFLWIVSSAEIMMCYDLQKGCLVDYTNNGTENKRFSNLSIMANGDVWLLHNGNGARQIVHGNGRALESIDFNVKEGNLPNDNVQFIKEDASGRAWIGTREGLACVHNGQTRIVDSEHCFVSSVIFREESYFITKEGDIYRHSPSSGFSKLASFPGTAKCGSITGSCIVREQLYIFTSTGRYVYDIKSGKLDSNPDPTIKRGKVMTDNRGNCWIYNDTGCLYYILAKTGETKEFQVIPEEKVRYIDRERYHVVHDSQGYIWISTYGNGLFVYDTAKDEMEHFVASGNGSDPISSDFLLYVAEDRAGGIWISYESAGMTRLSISNRGIKRIYPTGAQIFDRSNAVRMLADVSDDIWLGTRQGEIYKYDSAMELISREQYSSNVYATAQDSLGQLWIGTRGDGLRVNDDIYKQNKRDLSSLSHNHIFAIHNDRCGRMWIGTFGGGLNLAEPEGKGKYKFRRYLTNRNKMSLVRTLAEDENGRIWVGTSEGICIFHPDSLMADSNNYKQFSYVNRKFCANEIKCLYRDTQNRMWAGTSDAGLVLCTPKDNYRTLEYKRYGTKEGLACDIVQTMLDDGKGRLWVATEYGMSVLDPRSETFENYYFASYAPGNVYSENCACKRSDGTLLFGTAYGMIAINPEEVNGREQLFPVVFTKLQVNGIELATGKEKGNVVAYSDEITLEHYQNSFQIDFTVFDYSDEKQTKYKYWLENYDQEWNEVGDLGFASYKYLQPGTYILHVKSCNGTGIWNTQESSIKIVIASPFWKTGWAVGCYVFMLIAVLLLAYRILQDFNFLRNRIKIEKQLTEYKLVFFTNISHEFRTPLTLIRSAMEKMQRVENVPNEVVAPLKIMDKNVQRMLRLVNQLLEFRKAQNKKLVLSLEETDVIAFMREIYLSFNDIAEQRGMAFHFSPSMESYLMYIDKSSLDKIVYNLLSNAFKYTPAGGTIHFTVRTDEEKKTLVIEVADTGAGIPKDKQGELFKRFMHSSFPNSIGIGLHLTHELVTLHKGTIVYKENNGGGSVFTVCLPTDKAAYAEADFHAHESSYLKTPEEKVSDDSIKLPEMPSAVDGDAKPMNKRKVLIIEDDDEIRELLKSEIGIYFEVETSPDGTAGLEKARTCNADLIICDVMMPELNGFAVTQKLKTDFETSHIPIILLTALDSPDKQLEGIEAGADAYIAKPFSLKYLKARIFRLIEQREKLREKFSKEPGIVHTSMCTTNRDKEFMERLNSILLTNIGRTDLSIEDLAQMMKLSRTAFYTKVRGITGYAPVEYLRTIRLKKAAELLLSSDHLTVSEVAYQIGFNDPLYFSKCFKQQFGMSPSKYQKGSTQTNEAKSDEKAGEARD